MVLAPVCVYLCVLAMILFTHHHRSMAIHHTYLNSMQEGRPKYTCLTCSWQRMGTASSCHHLGPPLQSPPIPASKPWPAASPQFASVPPFFASALACSASTGAVVWWGWHPRSLLTERRMVVHPGAGSFPTPPPPTRPPHGPDAASRPLASKTQK